MGPGYRRSTGGVLVRNKEQRQAILYKGKATAFTDCITRILAQHGGRSRISWPVRDCPIELNPLHTCWEWNHRVATLGSLGNTSCYVVPLTPGGVSPINSPWAGHATELASPPQAPLRESPNWGRQAHRHGIPPEGPVPVPKPPFKAVTINNIHKKKTKMQTKWMKHREGRREKAVSQRESSF